MPASEIIDRAESAPVHPSRTRDLTFWPLLVVTTLVCVAWTWHYLLRGWVPHDDGAFAEAATRVLRGEVPHRDFLDIYTGGLAYVNAAALRLFGWDFASLRYPLLALTVLWVPAVYYIATRFLPAILAGALTFLALLWSVPNYPAAVPSWYNLFFATFGTAALMRYIEVRAQRWIFIAGLCGGVSLLAKVSGIFFIPAVLLFLWYHSDDPVDRSSRAPMVKVAGAMVIALLVIKVISGWWTLETAAYYVAPPLLMCGVIVARELRRLRGSAESLRETLRVSGVCLAGFALPIACFLLLYIHGGLMDWVRGVFVHPARRLELARASPPPVYAIAVAAGAWLAVAGLVLVRRWWSAAFAVLPLAYIAWRSYTDENTLIGVWWSMAACVPVLALAAYLLCVRPTQRSQHDSRVFLLAAVTCFCSLVQFPFSVSIYFCYVAPLVIVCIAAIFRRRQQLSPAGVAVVVAFYLWVGLGLLRPASIFSLGQRYAPDKQTEVLNLDRARRLRVLPAQAQLYRALVPLIKEHARGEYIYVTPSAPELYFMTGHRNPVPWIFDFFDSAAGDVDKIEQVLAEHDINVVVLNLFPSFDPPLYPLSKEMRQMLRRRYPNSRRIEGGPWVLWEVRWRD